MLGAKVLICLSRGGSLLLAHDPVPAQVQGGTQSALHGHCLSLVGLGQVSAYVFNLWIHLQVVLWRAPLTSSSWLIGGRHVRGCWLLSWEAVLRAAILWAGVSCWALVAFSGFTSSCALWACAGLWQGFVACIHHWWFSLPSPVSPHLSLGCLRDLRDVCAPAPGPRYAGTRLGLSPDCIWCWH